MRTSSCITMRRKGNVMRLRPNVAVRTVKDNLKTTVILTLIFVLLAAVYAAMWPAFKDYMDEMMDNIPSMPIRGFQSFASYPGFLNGEFYQIFWILVGGLLFAYIAGSSVSKEIEAKTMDMLLSNPIPRYRIVFEKFTGLLPMILAVVFGAMISVYAVTPAIGEEIDLANLAMTHIMSIPYFLSVVAIGLLVSVIIDRKMKASIVAMAIVIGAYILESISILSPDYEDLGLFSLVHYYDPVDTLLEGNPDLRGGLVLLAVTVLCLVAAMWYFGRRDIKI